MASDKESLKVLIISSEYPPEGVGGLGTHVFELTGGLSRANCDVTVFAPSNFDTRIYRKTQYHCSWLEAKNHIFYLRTHPATASNSKWMKVASFEKHYSHSPTESQN